MKNAQRLRIIRIIADLAGESEDKSDNDPIAVLAKCAETLGTTCRNCKYAAYNSRFSKEGRTIIGRSEWICGINKGREERDWLGDYYPTECPTDENAFCDRYSPMSVRKKRDREAQIRFDDKIRESMSDKETAKEEITYETYQEM